MTMLQGPKGALTVLQVRETTMQDDTTRTKDAYIDDCVRSLIESITLRGYKCKDAFANGFLLSLCETQGWLSKDQVRDILAALHQ